MAEQLYDIHNATLRNIERYIDDDKDLTKIPQPMFIVGSAGAGKSTLLRSLAQHLSPDAILFFDGKQFFNSREIILAIEGLDYKGPSLPDTDRTSRLIVIVDDIDYFFKRSSFDDQYLLRNYLNNEKAPLLIGSVSKIEDSLASYKAPFFEGVRLVYMPLFDDSVIGSLNLSADIHARVSTLMAYLPPVVQSFKTASEIIDLSPDSQTDLKELLNRFSQLYHYKYDSLPVYSQNITYNIAKAKSSVTLAELRTLTGLPAGTLSTYLNQLVKSGHLHKTSTQRRGTPYELRDPLFRLWLSSF